MTLDEALGQPGRLVAAWDYGAPDRGALEVYVTSETGARRIHREDVAPEQRQPTSDRVRERGIRLGGANTAEGLVWVFDDRGFGVWSDKAALVEGSQMVIGLRGGAIKARDIKKVLTSARGVRCELATGSEVPFVDEQRADPTWAVELGVDFAMWLGVTHVDPDGKVTTGPVSGTPSRMRSARPRVRRATASLVAGCDDASRMRWRTASSGDPGGS